MRFPIGDRTTLCIDWDELSLRVVEASFSRMGVRVRTAVHVLLDAGVNVRAPESLGDFLRKTLAEHRVRTRKVVVDVPREDAVLNRFLLPTGSRDELAAMVHVQIGKELPFSKDEAVIDFARVPPKEGATMVELWVAAVRTKVIDYYQQVISAAGLKLERIGLRPYANTLALDPSVATTGRTLMVDVGPSITEIDVIHDGHLVYSRAASVSIPRMGLTGPAAEPAAAPARAPGDTTIPFADDSVRHPGPMEALLLEVSRTIQAYRATDPAVAIDRIVLAGTMGITRQVAEAFEARFGSPTVVYRAPASLKWKATGKDSAAPFSAVFGLTLSGTADEMLYFDFLHPKEPEAERRERVRRRPVVAALVAVFVLVAGAATYQPISQRKSRIADLKAVLNTEKQGDKTREVVLKQLADLKTYNDGNLSWLDHLKKIAVVFPSNKDCYITELEMENTGRIALKVSAVNEMVANQIVEVVHSIRDEKGRRVFDASPGNKPEVSKDPKYPVSDQVRLEITSLLPAKPGRKPK